MIDNELQEHFIFEQICSCAEFIDDVINEGSGEYKGQYALAEAIAEAVYEKIQTCGDLKKLVGTEFPFDVDHDKYENVFFNRCVIMFIEPVGSFKAGYNIARTKKLKDSSFDEIVIQISAKRWMLKELFKSIAHELMHAYHHWKHEISNPDTYMRIFANKKYINSANAGLEKTEDPPAQVRNVARRFEYWMNKEEIDACTSEMHASLDEDNPSSIDDAVRSVSDSKIYFRYMYARNILRMIEHDEDMKKLLCDAYNEVNKTNKDPERLYAWMRNTAEKAFNRIFDDMIEAYFNHIEGKRIAAVVKECWQFPDPIFDGWFVKEIEIDRRNGLHKLPY